MVFREKKTLSSKFASAKVYNFFSFILGFLGHLFYIHMTIISKLSTFVMKRLERCYPWSSGSDHESTPKLDFYVFWATVWMLPSADGVHFNHHGRHPDMWRSINEVKFLDKQSTHQFVLVAHTYVTYLSSGITQSRLMDIIMD